jgi:nitrogen fixation protein FixH
MLAWILGFFGVIFAANVVMIWLAVGSFPGLEVDSSYKAGQAYNDEVAAAAAQAARGWKVDLHTARAGAAVTVTASFFDRSGAPERDLAVTVRLQHPTDKRHDRTATLAEVRPGVYEGVADGVAEGAWTVVVDAEAGGERLFRSRNPAVL